VPAATTTSFTRSFVPNKASFASIFPHSQRTEPAKPGAIKSWGAAGQSLQRPRHSRPHLLSPAHIFWKRASPWKIHYGGGSIAALPSQHPQFGLKPNRESTTPSLNASGQHHTVNTHRQKGYCSKMLPHGCLFQDFSRWWPAPLAGTCTGCLVRAPEPVLSYRSHLPCHAAHGTTWCPWRAKKQEAFSFTKCHISNSVETFARMPEVPSPVSGGQG